MPPCSTPHILSKSSPTFEFHLTLLFVLLNIFRNIVNIFPVKPLDNSLKRSACLLTKSKADLKIDVAYIEWPFECFIFIQHGIENKQIIGGPRALFESILPRVIKL